MIAVVGNFLRAKGADAIMSLIEEANPLLFRFHLLGNAEPQYAEVLARWNKPNVTYHGRYMPGDLSSVAHADVALHLSIWPETYCISMSEIWQAGLIPIVSDVGAFGDRVEHGVNGFKVRIGETSAVLDYLELLRASPATRRAMRASIGPHLWTDTRAYAASLLEIYRSVAPARPLGDVGLGLDAGQLHLLPHPSWKNLAPPRHIFDPSRRSTIRLELPAAIQDWSHVQGSEVYIDSVCGLTPEMLKEGFRPVPELRITGWTFVPNIRVGGQVSLALIGGDAGPVIFFAATRDVRDDIMASFPAAPRRSGFTGQIALRGKWCEGRYKVAIINGFGDRAAFCLTALEVEIEAGAVTGAALTAPSNEAVTRAFYRVAQQTGEDRHLSISRLPVKDAAWRSGQSLRHHVDQICEAEAGTAGGMDLPSRVFQIKGWAFLPGPGLAGRLYVGLVDAHRGIRVFVPTSREVRGDLAAYFSDAPLCGGFSARIEVESGWHDGSFACALVNLVGGVAYSVVTALEVTVRGGQVVSVVRTDPDAGRVEQVQSRLTGILSPTPTAMPAIEIPADAETAAPAAEPDKVEMVRQARRRVAVR